MTEISLDDARLKQLFKTALLEVLEERKDLLREAIEEALEDIALARAIEVGQRTSEAGRSEVFSVIEGGPESSLQGQLRERPAGCKG